LRRGITTGTTASAAVRALSERLESVSVETPVGINVDLKVRLKDEGNIAISKKFSGDHSFDITRGMEIVAKKVGDRVKKLFLEKGLDR
jgi:Cobalamin biosynthesis protein CbiD